MSSNLFSESLKVIFESASCLSRLSMVSSFEDTWRIQLGIEHCNVFEPRVMVLILRSIENVEWWCYLLICTPFSSSILFLTLWSALMQAPANSKVAWTQWIVDAISTIRDRKYIIYHISNIYPGWPRHNNQQGGLDRWTKLQLQQSLQNISHIICKYK